MWSEWKVWLKTEVNPGEGWKRRLDWHSGTKAIEVHNVSPKELGLPAVSNRELWQNLEQGCDTIKAEFLDKKEQEPKAVASRARNLWCPFS